MKLSHKLFIFLSLMLGIIYFSIPKNYEHQILYADTSTGGTPSLTLPTTGAIDIKKSWAQKLNENFQIISNTMTDVISGKALSPSSVTLQGNTFNGTNQLVQTNGNGQLLLSLISNLTFYLQNYSTGTNYVFNNSTFSILGGSVTIGNSFGLAIGTNVLVQGNGNVLIGGTGTPTSLLDVSGGSITIRNPYGLAVGTTVVLNSVGNILIGNPSSLGIGGSPLIVRSRDNSQYTGVRILPANESQSLEIGFTYVRQMGGSGLILGTGDSGGISFYTSDLSKAVITNAGNFGIGTIGPSSLFDINNGSITVRGTNVGINIVGGTLTAKGVSLTAGGGIQFPDGTVQISSATPGPAGAAGPAGASIYTSTVAITLKFPGDIYQATSPPVAIQGAMFSTGRGTFNVVSMEASVMRQSTKSATFCQVVQTTSTQNGASFTGITFPISPVLAITTSTGLELDSYSVNKSTKFVCPAFTRYELQVSSVADPNLGGSPPNELSVILWGWWNAWTLSPFLP